MQASTPQSTLSLPTPTLFDKLSSAVEQAKNWRVTLLFNVSNNKDNPNLVNLCHHMAPKKPQKGIQDMHPSCFLRDSKAMMHGMPLWWNSGLPLTRMVSLLLSKDLIQNLPNIGPACLIGVWIGRWVGEETAKAVVEIKMGEEGGIWGWSWVLEKNGWGTTPSRVSYKGFCTDLGTKFRTKLGTKFCAKIGAAFRARLSRSDVESFSHNS